MKMKTKTKVKGVSELAESKTNSGSDRKRQVDQEKKEGEDNSQHLILHPPKKSRNSSSSGSSNDNDSDNVSVKKKSGGHRPVSEVWAIISDGSVPDVHHSLIVICRFCGREVHTWCKASRALQHLQRKCPPGKTYLDSIPAAERTQFIAEKFFGREREALPPAAASAAKVRDDEDEVWRWLLGASSNSSGSMGEEGEGVQPANKVECQHCRMTYTFNAKPRKALRHLQKCQHAKDYFDSLPESEQTDFTLRHFGLKGQEEEGGGGGEEERQGEDQGQGGGGGAVVPHLAISEQRRFSELLALFFFSSGTASRQDVVENPYLLAALTMLGCRPPGGAAAGAAAGGGGGRGLVVPGKGQLMDHLLRDMHRRVVCELVPPPEEQEDQGEGEGEEGERDAKLDFVKRHHALLGAGLGVSLAATTAAAHRDVNGSSSSSTVPADHDKSVYV